MESTSCIIRQSLFKKIIDRETLYENKSIGHYEIAKIKFSSNPKDALKDINKALEFKKTFHHL